MKDGRSRAPASGKVAPIRRGGADTANSIGIRERVHQAGKAPGTAFSLGREACYVIRAPARAPPRRRGLSPRRCGEPRPEGVPPGIHTPGRKRGAARAPAFGQRDDARPRGASPPARGRFSLTIVFFTRIAVSPPGRAAGMGGAPRLSRLSHRGRPFGEPVPNTPRSLTKGRITLYCV